MKVIILAGGLGTRLQEETEVKPKPMVEIGGRPILWHIMKLYSHYGFNEFYIALGYKGEVIKKYFVDYFELNGSLKVDFPNAKVEVYDKECEDWCVNLIETGQVTATGGRVKRMQRWIGNEPFMMTYGDGVSNINIKELVDFHFANRSIATVSAVRPPARFGGLIFNGNRVSRFTEKPQAGEGWINGGFFVFEPQIFDFIEGDASSLETDVLEKVAANGELTAFQHNDFWQCMDTLRDKRLLEGLWQDGKAPWKLWEK